MTRPRTAHRALVIATALTLGLVLAACGGSDGPTGDALVSEDRPQSDEATTTTEDPGETSTDDLDEDDADSSAHDEAAADALRQASMRSAEQPSARTTLSVEAGGEVVTATDGIGNMAGTVFEGTTTIPGVGPAGYRLVDGVAYIEAPNLPNGATWMAISLDELSAQMGVDFGAQQDPGQAFRAAEVDGDVVELGPGEVDGVAATEYVLSTTAEDLMERAVESGAVSGAAAAMFSGPVDLHIWIDDDGLIRRVEYSLYVERGVTGMPMGDVTYEFTFSDYGVAVDGITAPAPETVISMADAMAVPN